MTEKILLPPKKYNELLKNVPSRARVIYEAILILSLEKGYCYASNKYFAEYYGIHRQTVWRNLKFLLDKGMIEQFSPPDCRNKSFRALAPIYYIDNKRKKICTENSTSNIFFLCTENGTSVKNNLCTENSTLSDKTSQPKQNDDASFRNEPCNEKINENGSFNQVTKSLQTGNTIVTSCTTKTLQTGNGFVTKDVTKKLQTGNKNVAVDTNKDIITDLNEDKERMIPKRIYRSRVPLSVDIFDQNGMPITLPNPYKDKEDGYHE